MPLISLRNIQIAFGGPPLLEDVNLQLDRGERVGLLGRNGAGKTTLLSILAGQLAPDAGIVDRTQGLVVARLPQDVPRDLPGTIFETVAQGLGPVGDLVRRHHDLGRAGGDRTDELLDVQHAIEAAGGWALLQRVDQVLSRLDLETDAPVASLSGGLVRRVLLARALAAQPDVLLLDEPTNHLDIASIEWLERFLLGSGLTLAFVTHDRAFLRRIATRIVELDRGRLFDFACDYDTFVERKEGLLAAESKAWERFDRKLAEEEAWIRQGIEARRTRNEGRVRALHRMREERRRRRSQQGRADLRLLEAERSGKVVAEVEDLTFGYDGRPIVRYFSTTVLRGDRVGVIGPNGAGKTTLLRLVLGQLAPDSGTVRLGTNLEILYFDQLRDQLDPEKTVRQNLAEDHDTVRVGDRPRHVLAYLQDFLFTPDRAHSPVRILSGGERNRLLLAKLFTRPANVLILDEPTNDLDLETLDLLESLLAEFDGTVFLVSHDRAFLDRVVTSTLVFEGEGRVSEYVGGYEDWLRQRPPPEAPAPAAPAARPNPPRAVPDRPRRLSYKEERELEQLPVRIEALEAEQADLHERLADPALYKAGAEGVTSAQTRLAAVESQLEAAYARWAELEALPG